MNTEVSCRRTYTELCINVGAIYRPTDVGGSWFKAINGVQAYVLLFHHTYLLSGAESFLRS